MRVTQGWSIDLGARWAKGDVMIEPEDVLAMFTEAGLDPALVRVTTNNEMFQLQSNEALRFVLVQQMQQAPEHFATEDQKDQVRALTQKNKDLLVKISKRDIPVDPPF